jgi:hypothetical protein
MRSRAAVLVVVACDVAGVILLRPDFGRLRAHFAAPDRWMTESGADGVIATLAGSALWLAALWLAVGLSAALVTRLPGAIGRPAVPVARALLPRVIYRVVVGSAGLGVLLAPVAATAAPPSALAPATAAVNAAPRSAPSARVPVPTPTWPTDPASDNALSDTSVPTPVWPVSAERPAPPATPRPAADKAEPRPGRTSGPGRGGTHRAEPRPGRISGPRRERTHKAEPRPGRTSGPTRDGPVAVRPGDSLWLISARRLGPGATAADIARDWPRWYAANRAAIGADPALILPGERLRPPPSGQSGPNSQEA